MARLSLLASLALTGSSTALQIPLNPSSLRLPFTTPWSDDPVPAAPDTGDKDKLPLVSSEALQAKISTFELELSAQMLYLEAKKGEEEYGHPTRVIGSDGHAGTLRYIHDVLESLGDYYNVSTQDFPAVSGNVFESRLVVGTEVPKTAAPMGLTPATHDNEPVYGDLVLVDNEGCEESDFPAEAKDNIVLVKRGVCAFGQKSENAGKAGAKAAIIYNTEPDNVAGTLGTPSPNHVATFGLGGDEGNKYVEKLRKGKNLDSIAYIDAEVKTIMTTNILAQTSQGDPENCVMLGGHSDSVAEGPGINDDGSGSLSLLQVAIQLSKFSVNNCVRFAWWAGEEEGLLGSDYYVSVLPKEENRKIRMFMDYDMMASPNFAYQVYNATNAENPTGSEELKQLYIDWYEDHGLNYTLIPFDGRSDYDGFIRNGIPGGGIATGAEGVKTKEEQSMFGGKAGDWYDPCYHQLCDDLSNLAYEAWEVNTKLIAHSVATYALSFEGFPERKEVDEMHVEEAAAYAGRTKYHGPKMFI